MQYVKQMRYYQAGDDLAKQRAAIAQTLQRKMEDAKCALDLEGPRHKTKDDILDSYLNIAFFGEHAYGIETAAETYFNTTTSQLTLGQSALLVGLLRAPDGYDPFVHPVEAKQRRNEVLQNLVAVGKLSQRVADQQKALGLGLATQSPPRVKEGCANADSQIPNVEFFCDYAVTWLKNVNGLTDAQLQTGGLKIITTLNPTIQTDAQNRIAKAVPASSPMTAILPVVDPGSGDVLAMATSKRYGSGKGATEQPLFTTQTAFGASTYKLFPLLTALQTGIPADFPLTTVGSTGKFLPTLCPGKSTVVNGDANVPYKRTETLQSATAKSSNTYYVALADNVFQCHLQPIVDLMKRLGMSNMDEASDLPGRSWAQAVTDKQRAQQLVLGSIPTSALQLAGAYGAVADGGRFNKPAPILSISNSAGSAIHLARTPGTQVLAPQVAAQAVKILKGDTKGQGTSASVFDKWYTDGGSVVAGKTGTNVSIKNNENSSVWFVGMTPHYVAASGVINFDKLFLPSSGLPGQKTGAAYGDYAAKIWLDALGPDLKKTTWDWPPPDSIAGEQDVPVLTGLDLEKARKELTARGFSMRMLDAADQLLCPNQDAPLETVGYYGPHRAEAGATITVCQSSGVQQLYKAPVIQAPPPTIFTPAPVRPRPRSRRSPSSAPTSGIGHGHRNSPSPKPKPSPSPSPRR
jgi:membrane peptidoglycan carboxypeptidase